MRKWSNDAELCLQFLLTASCRTCGLWREAWRWPGGSSLQKQTTRCCRRFSAATLSCFTLSQPTEKPPRSPLITTKLSRGYFLTLCHLNHELKVLSSRTCTTLLWSTLARTLKALRPPCSSLCSSGSSRPTRSDNARSIDSRHEWTDSADSCFSDNDEQLLLCSVSVIQPSDVDKTLFLRQQAEQENDRRKKQLVLNCDAPSSPPKPEVSGNKVTFQFPLRLFYQQLQD